MHCENRNAGYFAARWVRVDGDFSFQVGVLQKVNLGLRELKFEGNLKIIEISENLQ